MSAAFEELINKINIQKSKSSAIDNLRYTLDIERKTILSFVNSHAFNIAKKNNSFLDSLLASDIVYRDGIGVKLLYKMLSRPCGENLNGTDFIPYVLAKCSKGKNIAIFGSRKEVILSAKKNIEVYGGKVVVFADGFQDTHHYVQLAKNNNVDIFLLAMGMPKQEGVAIKLSSEIDSGLIVCGGAIVDFLGGQVSRAPSILIKLNLEWLFRLLIEPKRMFKRYVIGNIQFLFDSLIVSRRLKGKN